MSCIKAGNTRCFSCCEVLHIEGISWNRFIRNKITTQDGDFLRENFVQVSRRRAKKINPYMFNRSTSDIENKKFLAKACYFTCSALVAGVCTKYEIRPFTCRHYKSGLEYSSTCPTDSKIIARSID